MEPPFLRRSLPSVIGGPGGVLGFHSITSSARASNKVNSLLSECYAETTGGELSKSTAFCRCLGDH